ncbi:hypothetical protein JYQ62_34765 [Nostoc sp. UHCC 0702]|nr:hypothetical protein JYQ62_34765 [Nostoc sp. UHCC 0702]
MTELNDEEITNLVGGSYGYTYDGDLVDIDTGDIVLFNDVLNNNNVNVLSVAQNVLGLGLLGSGKGLGIF